MNDNSQKDILTEAMKTSYMLAKRLLPFLARRYIPATPKNYRIFYDYLQYLNPSLNKYVDELFRDCKFFDQATTDRIYSLFYSEDALESKTDALNKATLDIEALSSSVGQSLESAITQADHYQKVLSDKSKQIASVKNDDEFFQPLLEDLMAETEAALKSHNGLTVEIEKANAIIADLKKELSTQTQLATVDELTTLFNRRYFNLELPKYIEIAENQNRPISMIIFDLDHFKRVNDVWGHQTGDKVLSLCAKTIKKASRRNDLAVRIGGEEFLLLCPDVKVEEAMKLADRIRVAISETDITVRGESLPITISAGVSQLKPGEHPNELFARTDQALYKSKRNGRNLVSVG